MSVKCKLGSGPTKAGSSEDLSFTKKPEAVEMKSIIKDGGLIYGLGSDNNVYFWRKKEATWYLHDK